MFNFTVSVLLLMTLLLPWRERSHLKKKNNLFFFFSLVCIGYAKLTALHPTWSMRWLTNIVFSFFFVLLSSFLLFCLSLSRSSFLFRSYFFSVFSFFIFLSPLISHCSVYNLIMFLLNPIFYSNLLTFSIPISSSPF